MSRRVFRSCPIFLPNIVTWVDLPEFHMVNFDVILGMHLLHACFDSIDCRTKLINFNFPHEPILEWKWGNSIPRGRMNSFLKACTMISKGCLYHIMISKDY